MTLCLQKLEWWKLEVPFRFAFKHASATRAVTESVWVEASDEHGTTGYGESCPRSYVTGETVQSCAAFLSHHRERIIEEIHSVADLQTWVTEHAHEIDGAPAAWCAVEIALLDLFARQAGSTWESLLGLPPLVGPFQYTAVIGDQDWESFTRQVALYRGWGFEHFKVKLSGNLERDAGRLEHLHEAGVSWNRVRVDANNLWGSLTKALDDLRSLAPLFGAVEEPLRSKCIRDLRRLSGELERPAILDESFVRAAQLDEFLDDPERWWINVRVSKMGGVIRALDIV